jgi:hypothetical protein
MGPVGVSADLYERTVTGMVMFAICWGLRWPPPTD